MQLSQHHFFLVVLLGYLLFSTSGTSAAATITVAGTGDSQYLLQQLANEFTRQHPGDQVLIPNSVGSGGGIKLLLAGRVELARIARPLKPKEQAEGLQQRTFAYSPIVFVANLPESCLDSISTQQYLDLLSGRLDNWKQFGNCPDHKIYIANREEGDSSKSVLEQEIPAMQQIDKPAGRTLYSTPATYDTLSQYHYSFGYLPLATIQNQHLTLLKYNGISASKENVQAGTYPLVVPLGIVWQGQPHGLTKDFLDYLFSAEAAELMTQLNVVPASRN